MIQNINPGKVFFNINRVGNTVSASMPLALNNAMSQRKNKPGDTVLLSGFGTSLSCLLFIHPPITRGIPFVFR